MTTRTFKTYWTEVKKVVNGQVKSCTCCCTKAGSTAKECAESRNLKTRCGCACHSKKVLGIEIKETAPARAALSRGQQMRQTGRTQRMLESAISQARNDKYVLVICRDNLHREHLIERVLKEPDSRRAGQEKIYIGKGSISVVLPNNFDWREMRRNGSHLSCVVLADHYTIESEFSKMLEMLHRFD